MGYKETWDMKKQNSMLSKRLSETLLNKTPEEVMKIYRDAGILDSIQCHGYSARCIGDTNDHTNDRCKNSIKNDIKKWWEFWK